MVAKKTQQALGNNIIPLVCVQDENTPVPEGCNLVAYEPVWANVKSFISQANISGVLVGKASLDAAEFVKICK